MKLQNSIMALLVLIVAPFWLAAQPTKVACIGDSVTEGYKLENPKEESYPAQLQGLLGDDYQVGNLGVSGSTLLSKGHRPYVQTDAYQNALAYQPDVVIIHLGLNDTDPRNWPNYRDEFLNDYRQLIQDFRESGSPNVQIWICRMTPIFHPHPRFKSGTHEWFWQIQAQIEQLAETMEVGLIDLHQALYPHPYLFPDALHPNAKGAAILAKTVYQHLTGDFGGLTLAPVLMNQMVFQQKREIPVWGKADRHEKVMARLAGQVREVVVDNAGNWKLVFDPVPAGGPYRLAVYTESGDSIMLEDILVGELWLCAGQSNMEFKLQDSKNGKAALQQADHDRIRLFNLAGIARPNNSEWDLETLEKVNDLDYFEGNWETCSAATAAGFSAISYYFGKQLQESLDVPVGLIQLSVGGAPVESFIDRFSLESDPYLVDVLYNWKKNDFLMDWCRMRGAKNLALATNNLQRHPYEPAYIFEAGLQQLTGLPLAGTLWYQGESNAHNVEHYQRAFPALVEAWRTSFQQADMPFYFAQLSSLTRPSWPHFREAQRQLADEIPHAGMVVTSDLGDSLDVHPVRKQEVGERFARLALNRNYGQEIVCNGPNPIGFQQKGDWLTLQFESATTLTTADEKPVRELEVAGADGIFISTEGKLKGNTILIRVDHLKVHQVRYAWKPYSRGNLTNEEGLPASTFQLECSDWDI
ncbi:GDSL-type esterase/lipase family protein [Sunxiuqinia rutila]|uniref:GDSL-type esterase/lipase family protein n=1 Tax=Sunxiuqinia rutila TaxID=1397841 RepID=UPI003D35D91A